jgi:hypothetical protein
MPVRSSRSGTHLLEIMPFVEVRDEPGVGRLPAEQLAGQCAGSWGVNREEAGQPSEVLVCFLEGNGDHREVEMATDDLGDVAGATFKRGRSVEMAPANQRFSGPSSCSR